MNSDENCKYISTLGIYKSCEIRNNNDEIKNAGDKNININILSNLKPYSTVYICNSALENFAENFLSKINMPIILISGFSDDTISLNNKFTKKILESKYIIHWFCQNFILLQNNKKSNIKITLIPIGNYYHGNSPDFQIIKNGRVLDPLEQEEEIKETIKFQKPFYERKIKIYSTFHFELQRGDRNEAYNKIPKELIFYEPKRTGRLETYKNQIEYAFVASPLGNGLDCHRTWEALICGCIPIIKANSGIDDLFEDLPVLKINKWSDLTQTLLINTIKEITKKYSNIHQHKKIYLEYWIKKIHSYKRPYQIINVSNNFGIGDSVINLNLFRFIQNYLEKNEIFINYYLKKIYIDDEVKLINYTKNTNIILKDIKDKPEKTIDLWVGNSLIKKFNQEIYINKFDSYNLDFYNLFLNYIKIPLIIKEYYLEDSDLLHIYDKLDNKYKNLDILVINSKPISDSAYINKLKDWPEVIKELSKKYKIVTTEKVNNCEQDRYILCTRDDNLAIRDIGAISTNVSYIISTHTGPITACHNSYAYKNVKEWFIFSSNKHIKYEKIKSYSYEDINEIKPHFF